MRANLSAREDSSIKLCQLGSPLNNVEFLHRPLDGDYPSQGTHCESVPALVILCESLPNVGTEFKLNSVARMCSSASCLLVTALKRSLLKVLVLQEVRYT